MSYCSFSGHYCYGCFWKYPLETPDPMRVFTRDEETRIFKSVRDQTYLCKSCYKKCSPELERICIECGKRCELTLEQKRVWTHSELFDSLYDYQCDECWDKSLK